MTDEPRSRAVVIAGPTAAGKSALALDVAEAFHGAVINADSQQRYRDFPLLTAQPSAAECARVPHHLFGDLSADEITTAGGWARRAAEIARAAQGDGRLPLIVGGTGLYLHALRTGLAAIPAIPAEVRAAARALVQEIGNAEFHARLAARDPATAQRLRPGDTQRLMRAWEVLEVTGLGLSAWHEAPPQPILPADYCTILLQPPRDILVAACDARFLAMMEAGALDEVRQAMAAGVAPESPAMRALGARELARHLAGELGRGEAVAAAQAATRRYAKRQATWFRHQFHADLSVDEKYNYKHRDIIFPYIRRFMLT